MRIVRTSGLAVMVAMGFMGVAFAQNAAPPAGGQPGGGGPGGFDPTAQAPMVTVTLVPDMQGTIDVDIPGGYQGPQGAIMLKYSGQGEEEGHSPPLTWTAGPDGTTSYAIVMQDMGANKDTNSFLHWVVINIPATTTSLPEGIEQATNVAEVPGAKQLNNGGGTPRYLPPGPPGSTPVNKPAAGENEFSLYTIQVLALDTTLELADDAKLPDLVAALKDHILAYGIENVPLQRDPNFRPPGAPGADGPPGGPAPGGAPAGGPPPAN